MSVGAFSIDQLMELAGLSVSQAGIINHFPIIDSCIASLTDLYIVYRIHPLSKGRRVLVACGPGNNGKLPLLFWDG